MNYKKKIILFNPSPRGFKGEDQNFITPPLSLLGAASGLVDLPYEVIILDEIFDSDYKTKLISLKDNILLVGVTALTGHQIKNAISFAEFIRTLNKDIPIVWGGYHPSVVPEQTLQDSRVDIVCIGQAPLTFRDIVLTLENVKNNGDLNKVIGIGFKIDGRIIITAHRPIININDLPRLPYEIIDLNRYISDPTGRGERVIGYVSSVGCPWKCSFCAEVSVTKRRWSGLSSKRVVDDWEYFQKKYNVTHITIYDSMFVADQQRVKEIVKEIKARNLNISIGFLNTRTDQIIQFDDEFFELLKSIHCTTFLIGAESGDNEILRFIDKKTTVEQTIEAKKRLSRYGFTPMFSFMFGLEFDIKKNKKEFNDILDICDRIRTIDDNNIINIWNYIPYLGTPLTKHAIVAGYKPPETLEEYAEFDFSRTRVPWVHLKYDKWLEMLRNMVFPYISNQFRPNGVWEQHYKGRYKFFKKLCHRTLRLISLFRYRNRFFYFPIDYYLYQTWKRIIKKNILVGEIAQKLKS